MSVNSFLPHLISTLSQPLSLPVLLSIFNIDWWLLNIEYWRLMFNINSISTVRSLYLYGGFAKYSILNYYSASIPIRSYWYWILIRTLALGGHSGKENLYDQNTATLKLDIIIFSGQINKPEWRWSNWRSLGWEREHTRTGCGHRRDLDWGTVQKAGCCKTRT